MSFAPHPSKMMGLPSPGVRSDSIRWSRNASREAETLLDSTDINYRLPVASLILMSAYTKWKRSDVQDALLWDAPWLMLIWPVQCSDLIRIKFSAVRKVSSNPIKETLTEIEKVHFIFFFFSIGLFCLNFSFPLSPFLSQS